MSRVLWLYETLTYLHGFDVGTGGRGHRAISIERYDSRETAERDHRAVVARTTKVASVADDPLHSSPVRDLGDCVFCMDERQAERCCSYSDLICELTGFGFCKNLEIFADYNSDSLTSFVSSHAEIARRFDAWNSLTISPVK